MDESEKKEIVEDVQKVIKKGGKGLGSLLSKMLTAVLVALLTWLGSCVSKEYNNLKAEHESIVKRLADLEQDKAKWATLADLQDQQLQMKIQLEVMRQVWSYEYGRKVPAGFPSRPGEPELQAPPDFYRDVDRFKSMQEQKVAPKK